MTETKKAVHDIRSFAIHDLKVTRDVNSSGRQLSGYAVMFGQPSKPLPFIEYIGPSAFDSVDMSEVQLLYAHDFDNILARVDSGTLSLKTDDKGLFFNAQIPDTTLGNDVYTNVENGNLKGLSFSADIAPGGDEWATLDDGTVIHKINQFANFYEISLTPIPAYTETSVNVSRSYEEVLRSMDNDKKNTESKGQEPTMKDVLRAISGLTDAVKRATDPEDSDKKDQDSDGSDSSTSANSTSTSNGSSSASSSNANNGSASSKSGSSSNSSNGSTSSHSGSSSNGSSSSSGSDSNVSASQDKPAPSAPNEGNNNGNPGPNKKNTTRDDNNDPDVEREAAPVFKSSKGESNMDITPDNQNAKKDTVVRDFANFLKTGKVADSIRRDDANNIGLSTGSVIIPETIMTPEHEQYQFPRLGSLVRTVKVSTTTGKLPVFQTSDDKLSIHTEFQPSERHAAPEIKPINWDLKTYTGNYAFSQDLISDSSYNWQSELQSRLQELKDNTNDNLIINQLTNGVNVVRSTDLISDIKTALNVNLKPQDSAAASIILSQAAFNALDQLNDKMGRPLVQPNVTQPMGKTILGKTVVVVDDTLFPSAKAGDANVVVAPLQKAVINFQENEITGQFIDSYDIWYRILGIYLREDVVQARKDLITLITTTAATQNAASTGSDSSSTTTGK